MSSFIDGLLRKAKPQGAITAARVDFDCLILEQPPHEWELVRQRISERTLQSSFDKGDLALIAENAILWYDRLRRDARNERCLSSTPRSKSRSQAGRSTSPAPSAPPPVVCTPPASPSSPVLSPSLAPRLRDALEQETYLETLHDVLSERTKRVIRTEQLLRERNRHILDLQRQLTQQAGTTDSLITAMKMSLETTRADKVAAVNTVAEIKSEVNELSMLAEKHQRMWAKVCDHEGGVILGGAYTVITPAKPAKVAEMPTGIATDLSDKPTEIFLSEEELMAAGWSGILGGRLLETESNKSLL